MTTLQIVLATLLGIVLAAMALFASAPAAQAPTETVPAILPAASVSQTASTTSVVNNTPVPAPKPTGRPAATSASPTPVQMPTPATPTQNQTTTAPAPQPPSIAPAALNDLVRASVVNIVCTTETSGPFNSISASGVIIDSRGIVLTNAHVGQYFLLKDYPTKDFVTCIIRTGSPAVPKYTARLLFLPPSWIAKNASKINSEEPTGSGEHDYALLLITGTVNPNMAMPASLPALPVSVDVPDAKQSVFLAAYPAEFLGGITVSEDLYESSAFATVGDLYTFDANTLDLFSVGGTILSQHGSSGGAATDENGVLLGLIVTATDAASTATRDLRAISTPYIIHDFIKETAGTSLQAYLDGNVTAEANAFNTSTAPALTQQLVNALEGK